MTIIARQPTRSLRRKEREMKCNLRREMKCGMECETKCGVERGDGRAEGDVCGTNALSFPNMSSEVWEERGKTQKNYLAISSS